LILREVPAANIVGVGGWMIVGPNYEGCWAKLIDYRVPSEHAFIFEGRDGEGMDLPSEQLEYNELKVVDGPV